MQYLYSYINLLLYNKKQVTVVKSEIYDGYRPEYAGSKLVFRDENNTKYVPVTRMKSVYRNGRYSLESYTTYEYKIEKKTKIDTEPQYNYKPTNHAMIYTAKEKYRYYLSEDDPIKARNFLDKYYSQGTQLTVKRFLGCVDSVSGPNHSFVTSAENQSLLVIPNICFLTFSTVAMIVYLTGK